MLFILFVGGVASVMAHGHMTRPAPRPPLWIEENDVGHTSESATYRLDEAPFTLRGPMTHNGHIYSPTAYRCHDFREVAPSTIIEAGQPLTIEWQLAARHPGDCSLYVSYDEVFTPMSNASTWYKLYDFPGCADESLEFDGLSPPAFNKWIVTLPWWLPPCPHCVLRWEWLAVQQVTNVEFYVTCADVQIRSTANSTLRGGTLIASPFGHLPTTATAYRRAYDGQFGRQYLVGPDVATYGGSSSLPSAPSPSTPSTLPPSALPPSTPSIPYPPTSPQCKLTWDSCEATSDCCEPEDTCFEQHEWYAQCRPDCPVGWRCHRTGLETCVRQCLEDFT